MEEVLKVKKVSKKEQEVRLFIADKTKSVEERWTVFSEYCEKSRRGKIQYRPSFYKNDSFARSVSATIRESYITNETVKMVDLFQCYQSEMISRDVDIDNQKVQMNELKEYCMEKFMYKFKNSTTESDKMWKELMEKMKNNELCTQTQ